MEFLKLIQDGECCVCLCVLDLTEDNLESLWSLYRLQSAIRTEDRVCLCSRGSLFHSFDCMCFQAITAWLRLRLNTNSMLVWPLIFHTKPVHYIDTKIGIDTNLPAVDFNIPVFIQQVHHLETYVLMKPSSIAWTFLLLVACFISVYSSSFCYIFFCLPLFKCQKLKLMIWRKAKKKLAFFKQAYLHITLSCYLVKKK